MSEIVEITYVSGTPNALWKPELLPVYLFYGEEDRLKQEAVAALQAKVVASEWTDFDLESLDGAVVTADTILSAAGQIPFGSERRMVVVTGMEQWRDRSKQGEVERLAEGIERLASSTCLALVAAAEEEEARRKTAVSPKLDSVVKRVGAVVVCRALRGERLLDWIEARTREAGKRIDRDAAELLVSTVGSEMLPLEQEIEKLVCYVGQREGVAARDVGTVVASSPEDVMFATIDAITRRQTDRALTLLGELHRYDPKPQAVSGKLLSLLARQYRMLWQAKFLVEKRINPRDVRALPPELAAELPGEASISQLSFKAGELFNASRSWTLPELAQALERLLLCDLANKGGVTEETGVFGADPARNLQLLVLELTNRAVVSGQ